MTRYQPSALLLNETFLTPKVTISFPGYKCFRLDSPGPHPRARGGLMTIVRSDIGAKTVPHLPFDRDCLCIELSFNNSRITLINTYDNNGRSDPVKLSALLKAIPGRKLFAGDMNTKNTVWGSTTDTGRGTRLHDNLEEADLILLNTGEPTYMSPVTQQYSALDLSYISSSMYSTTSWRALCYGSSDHFPVLICNSSPINIWQWTKKFWKLDESKWDLFVAAQPSPPPEIWDCIDTDKLTDYFHSAMIAAGLETFGMGCRTPFKRIGPPWWNAACRRAIAARDRARLRTRSQTPADYQLFKRCVAEARRIISTAKRTAWEIYCTNLSHLESLTDVWRRAKNQSRTWNESFPTMIRADGTLAIADKDKAAALLEPYSSPTTQDDVATNLDDSFLLPDERPCHPIYDAPITMQELDVALRSAKLGAMGPDNVPYHFLLHLSPSFKALLLHIFNVCFHSAKIPKRWKNATLLPLLKPGKPPDLPASYRPIALASCSLKLLEKIIALRLTDFLETTHSIPAFQFGFRKGMGCTEALDELITSIKTAFTKQEVAICAFLDVRKAFDLTRHEAIRAALRKLQVPSKI